MNHQPAGIDEILAEADRYTAHTNPTYNYCRICGHSPTSKDEPNRAPIKFWDCDDGWIIGTLCRYCFHDTKDVKPSPEDYAYSRYYEMPEIETDEDVINAF